MEKKFFNKEQEIITTIISMLLIIIFYTWYVYQKKVVGNPEIINDFQFWGKSFLLLIPIMVGGMIVIFIVFAIIHKIITNADIDTRTDEMDRFINLKAAKASQWTYSSGFILAMVSQAIGMQPWVLFVVLISSCFIGAIAEGITKIYFYRKGV